MRKKPSGGYTKVKKHTREIRKAKKRIKLTKLKRRILMGEIQEEKLYIRWLNGEISDDEYEELKSELQDKYNLLDEENSIYCFNINDLEGCLQDVDETKKRIIQLHSRWDIKNAEIDEKQQLTIKPTKTDLNKVISWSTSKWNEYKKKEVIERILYHINSEYDLIEEEYRTGSYTTSGSLRGWGYKLVKKGDDITLIETKGNKKRIIKIEK